MIKNNKILFAIFLVPIMLLSGCGKKYDYITKETITSNALVQPQGKGTILGSVSSDGGRHSTANITLTHPSTGKVQFLSTKRKIDKNTKGRTYLINLNPGKYAITEWRFVIPGYPSTRSAEDKIDTFEFEINAGDYLYLGNFHIETVMGKNIFGIAIPAGVDIKVRNKKERDLKDLKRKFPKLPVDEITDNLITL